jgi:hypothetical protein
VCTCLSLTATSSLLVFLGYKKWKGTRSAQDNSNSLPSQGLFWLTNLFVAGLAPRLRAVLTLDFVQGLGDILVGVTVGQNSLMTGPGCTVQGFLINSGDVSSAIWSFVIAVHTFVLLAGGPRWRT